MVPVGDDNTSRRVQPVVTYALIALNVLFFFVELMGGDAFIETWAFIPSRFLANPGGDIIQWSGRIREFSYENLQVNGE